MKLSIVIPIYNEEANVVELYNELTAVLKSVSGGYEIIAVNDGSKDKSYTLLKELAVNDTHLKVIHFKHNAGQTAAMSAGIKFAQGDIIMPMDGDRQNNPDDIPLFLEKINQGYEVVSGWRKNRKDKLISRKIPSWIANWVIGKMTGVKLHDYGCSMKAYTKDSIQGIQLYGEMHRFIPAYVSWHGGRVGEIVVNHRPRVAGVTKYGISRTFKVILDLVVVKFLSRYMSRPMHFFGGLGLISFFGGFIAGATSILFRVFDYKDIVETPLPIFSSLLIIVGVQLIALGVIAEILMRTYYQSEDHQPYLIKEKINFD